MRISDLIRSTLGMTESETPASVTVARAVMVVVAGLCVGVVANALADDPVPLKTPARAEVKDLIEWQLHVEGMEATLEDVHRAFQKGGVWLVDVRSAYAYERGHIPGAVNLQMGHYAANGPEVLVGIGKHDPIITYCSGGSCQTSIQLATRLVEDGYTNVRAFYGGWGEWLAAGYPVREGKGE